MTSSTVSSGCRSARQRATPWEHIPSFRIRRIDASCRLSARPTTFDKSSSTNACSIAALHTSYAIPPPPELRRHEACQLGGVVLPVDAEERRAGHLAIEADHPRPLDGPVDVDVVGDELLRPRMGGAQVAPVVLVGGVAGDRADVLGPERPQHESFRAEAPRFGCR